jgi:23S rRNA (guanosine2251-2'-O)-methyltransferase
MKPRRRSHSLPAQDWIYGKHAAFAAAANPLRRISRLVATKETIETLSTAALRAKLPRPEVECMDRKEISKLLPPGAVHQGVALLAKELPQVSLGELCDSLATTQRAAVLVLDQITDPQNVGAVFRSAAAFEAKGVIVQDRNAPPLTGALAKVASGAVEVIPFIAVTNIARALRQIHAANMTVIGLEASAKKPIANVLSEKRLALVLGSEERGLRRLVREQCQHLAAVQISKKTESLNVSTAAAVALYEWSLDTTRQSSGESDFS